MPKFTKTEDELETMFDKWMFVPGFPRNRESVVYTRKAPQNGEPFLLSSQLQVRITLCRRHAVTHCWLGFWMGYICAERRGWVVCGALNARLCVINILIVNTSIVNFVVSFLSTLQRYGGFWRKRKNWGWSRCDRLMDSRQSRDMRLFSCREKLPFCEFIGFLCGISEKFA